MHQAMRLLFYAGLRCQQQVGETQEYRVLHVLVCFIGAQDLTPN